MAGAGDTDGLFEARAALILQLRQLGITDPDILRAFESVPHEAFVPSGFAEYAYREASLPIACGQSITAPTILAGFIAALSPQNTNRILEVGTGSGYSAALLSRMARRVFTIERHRVLAGEAVERWRGIGYTNIVGLHDDGLTGLDQQAPFDRILLNGSLADVPYDLLDQLADDGIAVMALGQPNELQMILRIERADDDFIEREVGTIRLPALVSGRARPG